MRYEASSCESPEATHSKVDLIFSMQCEASSKKNLMLYTEVLLEGFFVKTTKQCASISSLHCSNSVIFGMKFETRKLTRCYLECNAMFWTEKVFEKLYERPKISLSLRILKF